MSRQHLTRYAYLSIGAAILTIGLKAGAYLLTGSVGLLSDALESIVNLVAAIVALIALLVAVRPPDDIHNYGHDKAEYFSSGVEGALILVAALSIAYAALERLFNPQPLEQVGLGVVISIIASAVNWGVARVLFKAGHEHQSITLEADAHHLMTDVWTSVGVVIGVALVGITGLLWLDAAIALLVALNIILSGIRLVQRSALGLMDSALPSEQVASISTILDGYCLQHRIQYHALRTRQAGARKFVTVHILVPQDWTVKRGHDFVERIEGDIRQQLGQDNVNVSTHLEPLGDPASEADIDL